MRVVALALGFVIQTALFLTAANWVNGVDDPDLSKPVRQTGEIRDTGVTGEVGEIGSAFEKISNALRPSGGHSDTPR